MAQGRLIASVPLGPSPLGPADTEKPDPRSDRSEPDPVFGLFLFRTVLFPPRRQQALQNLLAHDPQ
jgi:hypothetical protein